jgi:hypothetical protein
MRHADTPVTKRSEGAWNCGVSMCASVGRLAVSSGRMAFSASTTAVNGKTDVPRIYMCGLKDAEIWQEGRRRASCSVKARMRFRSAEEALKPLARTTRRVQASKSTTGGGQSVTERRGGSAANTIVQRTSTDGWRLMRRPEEQVG